MPALLLSLASGILLAGFLSRLPSLSSLLLLVPLALVVMVVRHRLLILFFMFTLGFAWGIGYGHHAIGNILPEPLSGQDVWIEGHIVDLPVTDARRQRFLVDVEKVLSEDIDPDHFPERVQINWYESPVTVKAGECWRLLVRLKQPRSFVNPGGFDYEAWLLRRGVGAVGYVRTHSANQFIAAPSAFDRHYWRYRLQQQLLEKTDSPRRGVLLALLIGDRSLIEREQWQALQQTGTNHLVAISGLHVGFVALLGLWLGKGIGRVLGGFFHGFPISLSACFCASSLALFYSTMAGFSLPTQRALIMVLVAQVAYLLHRSFRPRDGLLLAFVLVVIRDPLAAFDPGFWLSFAAVAVLLLAFVGRNRPRALHVPGAGLVYSQWVVFIGLVLPLALLINSVALLAPVANLIAIPLVTFFVVPPLLLAAAINDIFPGLSHGLILMADFGLEGLFQWLHMLLTLSDNRVNPPVVFNAHTLWLAAAGLMLLLLPARIPGRRIGYVILVVALLLPVTSRAPLKMTVMDVGQGLAVVIQTAQHNLVYDTGPAYSESFEAGGGIIVPYLRRQGIRTLDSLIVSHSDNDHAGGMQGLLEGIPVTQVLWGEAPEHLAPEYPAPGSSSASCHGHPSWQWDEVNFNFIQTPAHLHSGPNNRSCVLVVTYKEAVVVLPGDIGREVEEYLVATNAVPDKAKILIAAHHGSKTSSSANFVQHLRPDTVIYSTGYRNRYGHPHPSVRARFQEAGSQELNTADSGALEFIWSADGTEETIEYRQQQQRYWYQ